MTPSDRFSTAPPFLYGRRPRSARRTRWDPALATDPLIIPGAIDAECEALAAVLARFVSS
jgi:hypothetical protein